MQVLQHFISAAGAQPFPEVDRGDGIYLWDRQGRRYLDGSSGAVAANIGHGNARVQAAMLAQASRVSFAYARVWENDPNVRLAEKLTRLAGMWFDAAFFVSGGSEAMEAAIKLARQVAHARGQASRWKVVSRMPSYHGSTIAMMGVSGDPEFAAQFRPMLVDMPKVPAPFTYRLPKGVGPEEFAANCAQALNDCIVEQGPDSVLAFVMEPVGGTATGALVAHAGYYSGVREICSRHGVLLIFDEVMSGAGRTGRFLAAHHWPDCPPDIVALAKGVSGGYAPLGAVLCSGEMVNDVRRVGGFIHGHTYAANPQSCAVACAVIDELVENDLMTNAELRGVELRAELRDLAQRCDLIGDVRGLGLLNAVEIVQNTVTRSPFAASVDAIGRIRQLCMEQGLMLLSRRTCGGAFGEWLMLCPPLIVTAEQVTDLVSRFDKALEIFLAELDAR